MSETTDVIEELRDWLRDNWDPDLTVAQWWERLGLAGWAAPLLPTNAYGRALPRSEAVRVMNEIADFGALPAPGGLGLLLAAPTIATYGTQEQIDLYVRDIVTGQKAWCQLFSEPGAGSDLAGLNCRAERDGDEWIINGQKVWTSGGKIADLGMLIARTNPDAPKHAGITYFAYDMHQADTEVVPLREMTGRAMFNEVFITDGRVHDDARIGDLNNGWAVANTTLMFERAGLGAGGGSAASSLATPGTIAGDLDKRAGDFVRGASQATDEDSIAALSSGVELLVELARRNGAIDDPTVRQDLMRLRTIGEIGKMNNQRAKALAAQGKEVPGLPNIAKLSMSETVRMTRDIGLRIVGPFGTLHAYDSDNRKALVEATGMNALPGLTEAALFAQGPPIYGGTDQVQRNIIGERVLGLPKEPGPAKGTPFKDLPKNG